MRAAALAAEEQAEMARLEKEADEADADARLEEELAEKARLEMAELHLGRSVKEVVDEALLQA